MYKFVIEFYVYYAYMGIIRMYSVMIFSLFPTNRCESWSGILRWIFIYKQLLHEILCIPFQNNYLLPLLHIRTNYPGLPIKIIRKYSKLTMYTKCWIDFVIVPAMQFMCWVEGLARLYGIELNQLNQWGIVLPLLSSNSFTFALPRHSHC